MSEKHKLPTILALAQTLLLFLSLTGCNLASSGPGAPPSVPHSEEIHPDHDHEAAMGMLSLPELEAVELDGGRLKVIATTSIIGDVVARVGSEAIQLTTLMGPGQDPHSYESGARELTKVAEAHVIFVNGWDLEEALARNLAEIGGGVPVVAISANIVPLAYGAGEDVHHEGGEQHEEGEHADDHEHHNADPHVWFSIPNVKQWTRNVAQVLSNLDPANAGTYERNSAAYLVELETLEAEVRTKLAKIPEDHRFLVTNHDSLRYFAQEYGFQVLGTVIPVASTLAEPSASELAGLIEAMEARGTCTLFTETTVSSTLAQTVATELDACDQVQVLQLFTGAIGPAGSGAESYTGMFRHNVEVIVDGLR